MGTKFTEKEINKRIAEGRGQGEFENYKPWLTVNDVTSSNSRAHKVYSWKINRIHHLLSDTEFNYFLYLEWEDSIIDIREQFPLDRNISVPLSQEIGITHPYMFDTYYVMSTDFLITLKDGTLLARTVKQAADLENESVIRKFQIEQKYWEKQNVDWGIVTEKDLDEVFIRNATDLRQDIDYIETQKIPSTTTNYIMNKLNTSKCTLAELFESSDASLGLEIGTSLSIYRCLIANKILKIDMFKPFSIQETCSSVEFNHEYKEKLA